MHDLDKALADISAIRSQLARGSEFRGYGPATIALTGVLAMLSAAGQGIWLADPASAPFDYVALWVATAAMSAVLIGTEMVGRSRRLHSGLADAMILTAIEQFAPAGAAGALITFVLFRFAPQTLWMLPGLWQIVFALGVFASCRCLPRPMLAAVAWYLAAGLISLAFANGPQAFSPWAMGLPFGLGQLMMAAILYLSVGADDAEA